MKNLKKKWGEFFSIIFGPWTVVLIASVALLFIFSVGQTNTTIRSLFFVLITITSAILGGRITKNWVDITEEGIVIARGKSAVRSLILLLHSISVLEQRVKEFEDRTDEIENHPEVTKRNYEEILGRCNLLEEDTVNSIENWTDIIPEADIKTQIGVISELKQSLQATKYESTELKKELNDTKDRSKEDRKKLEAEANKTKKKIESLEREIREKVNNSIIRDIAGLGVAGGAFSFPHTYDVNAHLFDVNDISKKIDEDLSKHIIDDKSKG